MKEKKCKICGKTFNPISSNHRYCDNCRFVCCRVCGKKFLIKPQAKNVQEFCSVKCRGESQKGKRLSGLCYQRKRETWFNRKTGEFKKCKRCGKSHYQYPRTLKRNFKNSFCSMECFLKYMKKNASPKRNNKDKEKEWSKAIYRFDNYTCWICETRGDKLNAHHFKRWAKYPKLRFKTSNGIALCLFCHKTYTDYGSWR